MTWEEMKAAAQQVRVIALDMDGTCLGAQHELTPRTARAIQGLVSRGYLVVPASGRGFYGLGEDVVGVPNLRYVISNNGAILTDAWKGKRLLERDIPPAVLVRMIRRLLDLPLNYLYCDDGEPDGGPSPLGTLDGEAYRRFYGDVRKGRPLYAPEEMAQWVMEASAQGVRFFKLGFFFSPESTYEHYDKVFSREFPEINAFHTSGERQYECGIHGISKGEALSWLCSHMNIAPEKVFAMGDNGNDAAMIQMAGIGVAMGNSPPEVQALADYVAGRNDQEGAAKLLEALFLS